MNKIIVREPDNNEGEAILLVVDPNGTIIHGRYPDYDDFCAEFLVDILALSKLYAPFTLHFVTEADVNKYLALAPIPEYPAAQDEEEEEEYDEYDDEDEYEDNDDYGYEEDGCTEFKPTAPVVTSLASLFAGLSVDAPPIENASRD